jgi:hypothetical protein
MIDKTEEYTYFRAASRSLNAISRPKAGYLGNISRTASNAVSPVGTDEIPYRTTFIPGRRILR